MLVSCICVTTARRRWCLPLAIRCFQRQTYPDREMVIVSDGPDAIRDLIPPDPRIRHVHLPGERRLGAKRNAANALARGEYLATWDDDDWHAPDRLAVLVQAVQGRKAAGSTSMLFHELGGPTWLYSYLRPKPYLIGGSMLYAREDWADQPFLERDRAEDTYFAWQLCARVPFVVLDNLRLYVAMVHSQHSGRSRWNPQPPRYTPSPIGARDVMGAELDDYERALASREVAGAQVA